MWTLLQIKPNRMADWASILEGVPTGLKGPVLALMDKAQTAGDASFYFSADAKATRQLEIALGLTVAEVTLPEIYEPRLRAPLFARVLHGRRADIPELVEVARRPLDPDAPRYALRQAAKHPSNKPTRYSLSDLKLQIKYPATPSLVGQYTADERSLFEANIPSGLPNQFTLNDQGQARLPSNQARHQRSLEVLKAFTRWNDFLSEINSGDFEVGNQIPPSTFAGGQQAIDTLQRVLEKIIAAEPFKRQKYGERFFTNPSIGPMRAVHSRWQQILRLAQKSSQPSDAATQLAIALKTFDLGLNHLAHRSVERSLDNLDRTSTQAPLLRLRGVALHTQIHAIEGGDELLLSRGDGPDPFSALYFGVRELAIEANPGFHPLASIFQEIAPPRIETSNDPLENTIESLSLEAHRYWRMAHYSLHEPQKDRLAQGIQYWKKAYHVMNRLLRQGTDEAKIQPILTNWQGRILTLEGVWTELQNTRGQISRITSTEDAQSLKPQIQVSFKNQIQILRQQDLHSLADRVGFELGTYQGLMQSSSLGIASAARPYAMFAAVRM